MTQPKSSEGPRAIQIRKRGQLLAYVAVSLFIAMPLVAAGLNVVMPSRHRPTASEILHAEFDEIIAARRARIAELQQTLGDACHRFQAPEYAKLLVMDGQWAAARNYAVGYEARCGADPNVRKWGEAPIVASARIK